MNRPRNVALYFACQALVASTTSLLVATSAMVGAALAPDARLATLPATVQLVATFLATYPASQLMARLGRRAGFSIGAVLGVLGGGAAALAIAHRSFIGFCGGVALIGAYAGCASFYRFAAAESVPETRRDRALGWVMTAGVLAAFLGPWLAGETQGSGFARSYVVVAAMAALALVLLQLAAPVAAPPAARRVLASSRYLIFTLAAMIAGAAMVFVMTATPLAMAGCHHSYDHTTRVIQWHVVAMFAPSFVTGRLVERLGAVPVVLAGLALCAVAAVIHVTGDDVARFGAGLFTLGLGWNLAYIGVSATLAAVPPDERAAAQGMNDLLTFAAASLASLAAGVVEHEAGWFALNVAVLPVLAVTAAVFALRAHRAIAPPPAA